MPLIINFDPKYVLREQSVLYYLIKIILSIEQNVRVSCNSDSTFVKLQRWNDFVFIVATIFNCSPFKDRSEDINIKEMCNICILKNKIMPMVVNRMHLILYLFVKKIFNFTQKNKDKFIKF